MEIASSPSEILFMAKPVIMSGFTAYSRECRTKAIPEGICFGTAEMGFIRKTASIHNSSFT